MLDSAADVREYSYQRVRRLHQGDLPRGASPLREPAPEDPEDPFREAPRYPGPALNSNRTLHAPTRLPAAHTKPIPSCRGSFETGRNVCRRDLPIRELAALSGHQRRDPIFRIAVSPPLAAAIVSPVTPSQVLAANETGNPRKLAKTGRPRLWFAQAARRGLPAPFQRFARSPFGPAADSSGQASPPFAPSAGLAGRAAELPPFDSGPLPPPAPRNPGIGAGPGGEPGNGNPPRPAPRLSRRTGYAGKSELGFFAGTTGKGPSSSMWSYLSP